MQSLINVLFISVLLSCGFQPNSVEKSVQFTSVDNPYIQNYKTNEFLKSTLPQKILNPESIDEELLMATLYFTIQTKRPKRNTVPLGPTEQLDRASSALLNKLSKNRIRQAMNKRRISEKKWKSIVEKAGFKGRFIAMAASSIPMYDYPKRFKVKYEYAEEGPNFSYLERKILKPVKFHTYLSFAEKLIQNITHSKKNGLFKSKGLSAWGCAIRIDQKDEKRLPYLSVVMLGGGYRLGLLEE